jgi:hypothetical protein
MAQAEFSGAIAAVAILFMAGSALAGSECAGLRHHNALGDALDNAAATSNPQYYEQLQRERTARATYVALLASGAPETLACAAALNPQVFQTIAPMYLRPSR